MAPHRVLLYGILLAEWILTWGGVIVVIAGMLMLLRPAQLKISRSGIEYRLLFSTRQFPWAAIQEIGYWWFGRNNSGVRLGLRSRGEVTLATGWPLDTEALAQLIEESRRRWGSYTAPTPRRAG